STPTADAMEEPVTHLVDGDTRTGPCISCGADGPVALDGGRTVFLHPACWQTTTPHDRMRWALHAVDTGLDPAHYQPDPDLSEQTDDKEQEPQLPLKQTPPAAARTVTKKAPAAKAPAGELVTAVVVDS